MRSKIAIGPPEHPWRDSITEIALRTGAQVADVAEAEALVWLGGGELGGLLHPGIRWVQLHAAGIEEWMDSGDIDDTRLFTSARGIYAAAVAEHALALILAASRRLHTCSRATSWDPAPAEGRTLASSTVGILGAGGIGEELIRLLQPFGVRTLAVTRSGRPVPGASESLPADALHSVWPRVDYLVLSAPATPDTAAIVSAPELAAMPDHAWLINVARGTLVDTDALADALGRGVLGGAALDVTEPEPLPDDHALWGLPNVVITPHVANPTASRRAKLEERIEANIARYLRGDELLGVVDLTGRY